MINSDNYTYENKIEHNPKWPYIPDHSYRILILGGSGSGKRKLLAIETKKKKVKMNKPVYLGLLILEISKTLMYEFWYDYMKPKYGNNVKLCYMDTDSFIMHIKTEDFYKNIANDVEKDSIHQIMKSIDHYP